MYLIAGLGNPDLKYRGTKHNVGFDIIDRLLDMEGGLKLNSSKFNSVYIKTKLRGEDVVIMKPLTYMNLSGEAIAPMANFYKIPKENIIVCFDDVSLDIGKLRIRKKGSAGGHNGIKSIIKCLGGDVFPRVKVGVGEKPDRMDLAAYVLSKFTDEEMNVMEKSYKEAAEAVLDIISLGADKSMNRHNSFNAVEDKKAE